MDNPDLLVFANNRQAAMLILLVALGILVAAAFSLLRPWPPGIFASVFFGIVAVSCLAAIARRGRWQAWRRGYAVQRLEPVGSAPSMPTDLSLRSAFGLASEAAWNAAGSPQPPTAGRTLTLNYDRQPVSGAS